jgi:hypothetical protein
MPWIEWLRARWEMLNRPAPTPREESIALSEPIATAIGRLQRAAQPRSWFEEWLHLEPHVLYGTVVQDHVELFFTSGA